MSSSFEDRLDAALDALNETRGDDARFSTAEPEIAELARIAAAIKSQPQPLPSAAAQQRGRARLLGELAQLKQRLPARRFTFSVLTSWRVALVVVVFVALCGAGMLSASANSLPGDWLYGMKLTSEQVALALTFEARARQQLEDAHTQKRLQEVENLRALRRPARTQLEGDVQGVAPTMLVIQGVALTVEPKALQPMAQLKAGDRIKATIQTDANGNAVVTELQGIPARLTPSMLEASPTSRAVQPAITASYTPTPLSVVTNTPIPTSTRTPASTTTPTVIPPTMLTPTPASTSTPPPAAPHPTLTLTPLPSHTATAPPTPSNTPRPTASSTPQSTHSPTPHATLTLTPEPTEKPELTDTPAPPATPTLTRIPPTLTPTPRPTLTPTRIPPTPTTMPSREPTPQPTLTSTPVNVTPTRIVTQTPIATTTPKPTPIIAPTTTPHPTPTPPHITPAPSVRPTLERTPTRVSTHATP